MVYFKIALYMQGQVCVWGPIVLCIACSVYFNSPQQISPAWGPIRGNWSNQLKAGPLYLHIIVVIQVHTIQRRIDYDHYFSVENCAVAVRAASDIFIINGCGNTTKWEIRRLNCAHDREYLAVYKRGTHYEVSKFFI